MSLTGTVSTHSRVSALPTAETRFGTAAAFCAKAIVASLLVAACSHIALPMPFTPVPFTMQPFAVLLVGMLFGPTVAFSALALYLAEGAAGLPVFTPLGLPGVARLVGPTGGYLFSYPLAAAIAGIPLALRRASFGWLITAGIAALALVYSCGVFWFSVAAHLPFTAALGATVTPFVLADFAKACVAAGIASSLRHVARAAR